MGELSLHPVTDVSGGERQKRSSYTAKEKLDLKSVKITHELQVYNTTETSLLRVYVWWLNFYKFYFFK